MIEKNKKKRKHDIILGLILLSVASILFVIDLTNVSSDAGNKKVVVSVDGKKTAEYPLKRMQRMNLVALIWGLIPL